MKNATHARVIEDVRDAVRGRMLYGHADDAACSHPGAGGPCVPRVRDGRCIWCEREMPRASARARVVHGFEFVEVKASRADDYALACSSVEACR